MRRGGNTRTTSRKRKRLTPQTSAHTRQEGAGAGPGGAHLLYVGLLGEGDPGDGVGCDAQLLPVHLTLLHLYHTCKGKVVSSPSSCSARREAALTLLACKPGLHRRPQLCSHGGSDPSPPPCFTLWVQRKSHNSPHSTGRCSMEGPLFRGAQGPSPPTSTHQSDWQNHP